MLFEKYIKPVLFGLRILFIGRKGVCDLVVYGVEVDESSLLCCSDVCESGRVLFVKSKQERFTCFINSLRKRLSRKVLIIFFLLANKLKLVSYQKDFFQKLGIKSLNDWLGKFLKTEIMKKIIFFTRFKIVIITCILVYSIQTLNAQTPNCSYYINNNGSCPINVTVVYMDMGGVCSSSSNVTINSLSSQVFYCGSCSSPLMDVIVTLNFISTSSSPLGAGFVNASSNSDNGSLFSSACNGQLTYNMFWTTGATDVNY